MMTRRLGCKLLFIAAGIAVILVLFGFMQSNTLTLHAATSTPLLVAQAATATVTPSGKPCGLDVKVACAPDTSPPPSRKPWVAPTIGASACVDWTFYHSDKTGNINIYRLGEITDKPKADADITKGTGPGVEDLSPSRSPDGKWVAFTTNRNGNWEIYMAAADASSVQRVTYTTTAANISPMWSPDGKYIVFETTRHGSRDLYLFNVATAAETRLTTNPANDVNPFWSPDSTKILFQTDRDGLWQIYQLDIATLTETKVSNGQANDTNPQYSPDGKQIAFRSYSPSGTDNSVIYTMNVDGSNRKAISDPKGSAVNQAWSPDGTLIAYQSDAAGNDDIYVYQLSSQLTRRVTDNNVPDYAPAWRCNASIIIFTSMINVPAQIYQTPALPMNNRGVKPDDTNELTFDKGSNQYPQNYPSVEDASHRVQEGNP